MKKVLSFSLAAILLFALVALCFTGCFLKTPSVEEVETNLKNAGYMVAVVDGDQYGFSSAEVKEVIAGYKGQDGILVFFFNSTDTASIYADNLKSYVSDFDGSYTGQDNSIIYLATSRQAVKDAGL